MDESSALSTPPPPVPVESMLSRPTAVNGIVGEHPGGLSGSSEVILV